MMTTSLFVLSRLNQILHKKLRFSNQMSERPK